MEILLEEVGPNGLQVNGDEFLKFDRLLLSTVLWTLEQASSAAGEYRLLSLDLECLEFSRPDFINGLVHMAHDVETIENIDGLAGFLGHNLQVRFPHVSADESQHRRPVRTKLIEETHQGFLRAIFTNPEESLAAVVDLVNQRQKLGALLSPADFVDAECGYVVQVPVSQAPDNSNRYGAKDIVPFGLEGIGNLFPGKVLRPFGKKPGVGGGQVILAFSPGNSFHRNAAARTSNSPHGIPEKYGDAPQRNKLKAPNRQGVVTGTGDAAT